MLDLNQANQKIIELLEDGISTRSLLLLATHHRRIELEHQLIRKFGNRIADGPFKDMVHTGNAHSSLICPKILGTYEAELIPTIKKLTVNKSTFLDIGCAEGYYTTGIGLTTEIPYIIGVDISKEALSEAKKLAELNDISHKCHFNTKLSEAFLKAHSQCLIMIDVDGNELEVIRQVNVEIKNNNLKEVSLIVETDYDEEKNNLPDIIQLLAREDFSIDNVIAQNPALRFSSLATSLSTSLLDQTLFGLEGRRTDQKWIIASKNFN